MLKLGTPLGHLSLEQRTALRMAFVDDQYRRFVYAINNRSNICFIARYWEPKFERCDLYYRTPTKKKSFWSRLFNPDPKLPQFETHYRDLTLEELARGAEYIDADNVVALVDAMTRETNVSKYF